MTVLVTDGSERAALAVVRSIGRHESVIVTSPLGRSVAGASRFAHLEVRSPSPLDAPTAFVEAVAGMARTHAVDAVFPVSDAACRALVGARALLGTTQLLAPPADAYTRLSNKLEVTRLAAEQGLGVPPGSAAVSLDAALSTAAELGYPTVLKPATSVVDAGGDAARKTGVIRVADPAALRAAWSRLAGLGPVLVQRIVPGWGEGIFVLRWAGRTQATFAHRRLREKPPEGGVSVLCESVALDLQRTRRVEAVMDAVGYEGLAMAEFKTNGRKSWLMEFNARPWGSLQLAVDAGVDFPWLLLEAFRGKSRNDPPQYAIGLRSRWLLGDVDHAIALARGGVDAQGRSGFRAALRVLLRPAGPRCRWEDPRLEDPAPFIRALGHWLREFAR